MAYLTLHQPIYSTLLAERETLGSLLDVMQLEQRALVSGDGNNLTVIAAEKRVMLLHLQQLEQLRRTYLVDTGLRGGAAGLPAWLDTHLAKDPALASLWSSFVQLVASVQATNELNGKLIATRLNYARQQLAVLTGAAAGSPQLYAANGVSLAQNPTRRIGAA